MTYSWREGTVGEGSASDAGWAFDMSGASDAAGSVSGEGLMSDEDDPAPDLGWAAGSVMHSRISA